MRVVNYNKLSTWELIDKYWEYEIEISEIAFKYRQTERHIIENSNMLTIEDKHRLGVLLWEVVNCLHCYNSKKKKDSKKLVQSNVIQFRNKGKK